MNQPTDKKHILTVLLEDYFQVGAFNNLIREQNWSRFEPRYVQNTLKTLDLLDKHNAKATFFTLGWIAEQSPDLIREIVRRGHEVASRGYNHLPISQMTPDEFRCDVLKTRDVLERASGQQIYGHRAAEKLEYKTDLWTLDVLARENFVYDASFLPGWNTTKQQCYQRFAHEFKSGEQTIWELPYPTRKIGQTLMPISGGNYFRQIPYTLLRHSIEKWHSRIRAPFLMYFHVWELDAEQPRINAASTYNRLRHYRKLDKIEWILEENLKLYQFTSAIDFLITNHELRITNQPSRKFDNQAIETDSEAQSPKPKTQNPKPKITLVIPCYNEEKTLPYLANTLRGLETKLADYETNFIFVDDCSTDATRAELRRIFGDWANAQIIEHPANKGVAAAIMTGIRAATTEIVASLDADCSYDPFELTAMIPLLEAENAAMVTASPYHRDGGVRNVPAWRLSLSKGASFLYQKVLRHNAKTFTSCFRVYRKSAAADIELRENGFLGVAELFGKMILRGEKIVEHPAVLEVRLFGFSKMKTARTIAGHLKLLARLWRLRTKNQPRISEKKQPIIKQISLP